MIVVIPGAAHWFISVAIIAFRISIGTVNQIANLI
jgi:hypothetical protein